MIFCLLAHLIIDGTFDEMQHSYVDENRIKLPASLKLTANSILMYFNFVDLNGIFKILIFRWV